jgi:hypothetical protein
MFGLCLAAVFATAAVTATSALAKKDPYSVNTWNQYKYCEFQESQPGNGAENCYLGRTSGGSQGGFFQFGKINVKLSKPIVLQGFEIGAGPNIFVTPAVNGGETLEAPELPVTKGLKVITPKIQEEAEWPQALKESYKAAVKNHESAVNVKIEVAGGNLLYETEGALSSENIIVEEGDAFKLPLKVKITGPWLETLGGGPCYVGNDEYPIWQHLTTGGAGAAGSIAFGPDFDNIELAESTLVDVGWHIPAGAAPSGCGGEYESYVDAALSDALELHPWKTGITVLKGDLFIGLGSSVKEHAEKGEVL